MTTLLLTAADISSLMAPADYLQAVERSFRLASDSKAPPPMEIAGIGGAFHVKGAAMFGDVPVAGVKLNANFPDNPRRGLPTIQGVMILCDATNGRLIAIMDSAAITLGRTAAATALAARHLARPNARRLAICGCGAQARAHVHALAEHFVFESIAVWDVDPLKAEALAADTAETLRVRTTAPVDLRDAVDARDLIVTCTTARSPFLEAESIAPGAFIAAIGADNATKSEIAPMLMRRAKVVTDSTAQCVHMGDSRAAIAAGAMMAADIHAELGEIIVGSKPGRTHEDDIIVFDSTGIATQDVASAAVLCDKARSLGGRHRVALS